MINPSARWAEPPRRLVFERDDVHVWRLPLEQPADVIAQLERLLSPDEQARAWRFVFEQDRRQFICARGGLRLILGRYLGLPPQSLLFRYGLRGKPELLCAPLHLSFNISHAHNLALYAIALDRAVGIDLEYIRPFEAAETIARRYFAPCERAALQALPAARRLEAFFTCWTRKEAFVKALGVGLSHPLDQFAVTLTPDSPAALLEAPAAYKAACWSLQALAPAPGYVAALAVEGHQSRLQHWQATCLLEDLPSANCPLESPIPALQL